MTRKNRQKHRQNDRQFAAWRPGLPAPGVLSWHVAQPGPQEPALRSPHGRALLVYDKRVAVYNIDQ
jgi:hypothetical protein